MAEAKFKFSLEPLLDVRKEVEKEKQRKVGKIQQEENELLNKIRGMEQTIRDQTRFLATQKLTGMLDLTYITQGKVYVGNLNFRIIQTMQQAAVVRQRLNQAKAELLEAARARKVIEKLKEKQLKRWQEEQARKEAAFMDEIGTQLALRRMREDAEIEEHKTLNIANG